VYPGSTLRSSVRGSFQVVDPAGFPAAECGDRHADFHGTLFIFPGNFYDERKRSGKTGNVRFLFT